MPIWIISANPNTFDHHTAFQKNGFIDWEQHRYTYQVGDLVYIYDTGLTQIKYLCEVEDINIPFVSSANNSANTPNQVGYWKNFSVAIVNLQSPGCSFVRLRCLRTAIDGDPNLSRQGLPLRSTPKGLEPFYPPQGAKKLDPRNSKDDALLDGHLGQHLPPPPGYSFPVPQQSVAQSPAPTPTQPKPVPTLPAGVQTGTVVTHKKFGTGRITSVNSPKPSVEVTFNSGEKKLFPFDAFDKGVLV